MPGNRRFYQASMAAIQTARILTNVFIVQLPSETWVSSQRDDHYIDQIKYIAGIPSRTCSCC